MAFPSLPIDEDVHDAFGGPAVPQGGPAVWPRWVVQGPQGLRNDPGRVGPDDSVGAVRHRDRTFRRVPEGEAGDPEDGGLLLNAPGVRQDQAGSTHEGDEVEIA